MISYDKLINAINDSNSFLCTGLDTSIDRLPSGITSDIEGLLKFNRKIIDATAMNSAAYKINFAFYEQYGPGGFDILKKTIDSIPKDKFVIADAKRGDIGNTSAAYAKSCFEYFGCDAITVNPYMGYDSVNPFLEYKNKFVFLLALTSNKGSSDFQYLESDGKKIYKHVIDKSIEWSGKENLGFVFGATHAFEIADIRKHILDRVLLIPGIGAQGGNIEETIKANGNGPALINVSRDIIYRSSEENFAESAREKSDYYKNEFNKWR